MSGQEVERPSFFEGQYLGAEDLDALVMYCRDWDQRHALGGHTWGIAMGLELRTVTTTGTVEVFLQPGYAWDGYGRPIVVLSPYKIPPETLAQCGTGTIPVWLRYDESEHQGVRRGFEVCDAEDSYLRVRETFQIEVGYRASVGDRQSGVTINGDAVSDAREALLAVEDNAQLVCDASVPHQGLPEDDTQARWLIPIGYVNWEASAAGTPGELKELTEDQQKLSRLFRRYAGLVAQEINAADGVLRLRSRTTDPPDSGVSNDTICDALALKLEDVSIENGRLHHKDLVWVEGNLRVTGHTRLHGTRLELREVDGTEGAAKLVPLFLRRGANEHASADGRDLQCVIGQESDAQGDNRLSIGTLDTDDTLVVKTVVTDIGRVGIGTDQPATQLHIKAESDPTLKLELDGGNSPAGRITLRSGTGAGADVYFDDTPASRGMHFETISLTGNVTPCMIMKDNGRVGVGTVDPDHRLQVGDATASVTVALRGPDGDPNSSALAFEDDGGTAQRWFRIVHNSSSNLLKVSSAAVDSIMTFKRTACQVGIGTDSPSQALDVNGRIVRKGSDLTTSGSVSHNNVVTVPWGTTSDWNIFVSPRQMGEEEGNSEADNAILKIQCWASAQSSTSWLITARYKFKYWNENPRTGVWRNGSANYLLVPK